ncbi:LOW QUALITY PROTEIN: NADH-dependent dehydrogenase [Geomicrobium sp. JCM 19039]|nr:LOW QUALITY PROTEIN: NADH-dependent dehydrogenase [Geomicrobium sp. JCM 19039]
MQRTLVIGLGTMGSVHTKAFYEMPDAELVGVVDRNPEKRHQFSERYETNEYETFQEALIQLNERIDVVSICLPTDEHPEYVKQAADAGIHVICEKPIARTPELARELIDYCKAKKVQLFVGHVVRFFQEYVEAKKIIDSGAIGTINVVRTRRGGAFPQVPSDWYSDYSRSGGLVLDTIIHDFDFLRWCFGDVTRVYAKSIAGPKGVNEKKRDYALVTLRFSSGVIAHVEGTWAHRQFSTAFEFSGTDGVIDYDSQKQKAVMTEIHQTEGSGAGVAVPESPLQLSPYDRELRHFISCIETGSEPVVTAEDAYEAVVISHAALASIADGDVVEITAEGVKLS